MTLIGTVGVLFGVAVCVVLAGIVLRFVPPTLVGVAAGGIVSVGIFTMWAMAAGYWPEGPWFVIFPFLASVVIGMFGGGVIGHRVEFGEW